MASRTKKQEVNFTLHLVCCKLVSIFVRNHLLLRIWYYGQFSATERLRWSPYEVCSCLMQFAVSGDRKMLAETERRVQRLLSHQEATATAAKHRELWEVSRPRHGSAAFETPMGAGNCETYNLAYSIH